MTSALGILWRPWRDAARLTLAAMDAVLGAHRSAARAMAALALSSGVSWFVYVPIHELLHALGCIATGGTVSELQIQAIYGGALLERIVPFVRAGGEYAGRLTGFDTGGSDLTYLATDAAPFLLTLAGGFLLIRAAGHRGSPWWFGPGFVLLLAPLISLIGDYYEMGSIVTSGALILMGASPSWAEGLRHDDLPALLGELGRRFPEGPVRGALAVAAAAAVGYVLATLTLAGSSAWAQWLMPAAAHDGGNQSSRTS